MTDDAEFSDAISYFSDPHGRKLFQSIVLCNKGSSAFSALFGYLNEKQFDLDTHTDLKFGRLKDTRDTCDWCMRMTLHNQTEEFGRKVIAPWLLHWHVQWARTSMATPWVAYNRDALYVYVPIQLSEVP